MKENKVLEGILQNSSIRNASFLVISKLVNFLMKPSSGFRGEMESQTFGGLPPLDGTSCAFYFLVHSDHHTRLVVHFYLVPGRKVVLLLPYQVDIDYSRWSPWMLRSMVFLLALLGIYKFLLYPCYSSSNLSSSVVGYFCL